MKLTGRIRVYLVDSHPVFRLGVAGLLRAEQDMMLVGEAEGGREALVKIPKKKIDVLVLDLALEDMSGLELVRELRREYPDLSLLVLSSHDEAVYAERALKLGADGYLMKKAPLVEIVSAIRRANSKQVALSKRQSDIILKRIFGRGISGIQTPFQLLSDRELEVFELMGQGKSTRNVAEQLFISMKTVETHQAHIKQKLGLTHLTEVMRAAFGWVNDLSSTSFNELQELPRE